jgi:serine/threonine-protein kinase
MPASEPPFPPPSGSVLAGKYTVGRVIGRGGMAFVLEARHEALDTNVAVKILHPDFRLEEEATSRFHREARAVAKLTSSHVARVLDVDTHEGSPFMVLELLNGVDLHQELTRQGPLPIHEAVTWVIQACEGMHDAHRAGIVHRDLKPANLFLAETPAGRSVKILDFGISKLNNADPLSRMTTTQSSFGTPLYMSPEQVRSVKHVDARTDVWSLGVILYEALTCRAPFEQASASALFVAISIDEPRPIEQHRPELPAGLSAVLMKALQKRPDDRYQDVAAFAAALRPYSTAEGVASSSLAIPEEAVAGAGGKRRAALVVAACVIAGIASLATARVLGERPSDATPEATAPVAQPEPAEAPVETAPPPSATVEPPPPIVASSRPTDTSSTRPATKPPPATAPKPRPSSASSARPPTTAAPQPPPVAPADDPRYLPSP